MLVKDFNKDFIVEGKTESGYIYYNIGKAQDYPYYIHVKHFKEDMNRSNITIISIDDPINGNEDQHFCSGKVKNSSGEIIKATYIWNPNSWFTLEEKAKAIKIFNHWRNTEEVNNEEEKEEDSNSTKDNSAFQGLHIPVYAVDNKIYDIYIQGGSEYKYAWITKKDIDRLDRSNIFPFTKKIMITIGIKEKYKRKGFNDSAISAKIEEELSKYSKKELESYNTYNCTEFHIFNVNSKKKKDISFKNNTSDDLEDPRNKIYKPVVDYEKAPW